MAQIKCCGSLQFYRYKKSVYCSHSCTVFSSPTLGYLTNLISRYFLGGDPKSQNGGMTKQQNARTEWENDRIAK